MNTSFDMSRVIIRPLKMYKKGLVVHLCLPFCGSLKHFCNYSFSNCITVQLIRLQLPGLMTISCNFT